MSQNVLFATVKKIFTENRTMITAILVFVIIFKILVNDVWEHHMSVFLSRAFERA